MRILFLCRFLPHPRVRDAGGQMTYHYVEALARRHAVSLIAFATRDQADAIAAMRGVCREVVTVPYDPHALLPRLWRLGWRLLLPRVYGRNVSPAYGRALRGLLARERFDVAVVDGMMARHGLAVRDAGRVLDEIDVYATVAYQAYRNERRPLARLWKRWDWLRTQAHELRCAASYDAVLVHSEKDRQLLRGFLPAQRVAVVPPWFEGLEALRQVPLRRPAGNRLLFVGAMGHPENVEAATYFVRQILPLVRRQVGDATLDIVGGAPAGVLPARQVRQLTTEAGVTVVGEVEDLAPYYARCAVNVVPLRVGGGVILKTLNGLVAGRPTVATSAGNAGTGARPGRDLLVADHPAAFAEAVVALLTDPQRWHEIAANGRRYVAEHFRWEDAVRALEEALQSAVEAPRHAGA